MIRLARESGKFDTFDTSCVPKNARGMRVYTKLGFVATGEFEDGEAVLSLRL